MKNKKVYIALLMSFILGCVASAYATASFVSYFFEFTSAESILAESILTVNSLQAARDNKLEKSIQIQESTLVGNIIILMHTDIEKNKSSRLELHKGIVKYIETHQNSFPHKETHEIIDKFIKKHNGK